MENQQAPLPAEGEAKVITLCGSTEFEAEFAEVNQRLTMEGCVVISLGMFSLPELPDHDWTADSPDLKGRLGGVHFQKIRMADEVCSPRISAIATLTVASSRRIHPRDAGAWRPASSPRARRHDRALDSGT